MQDGADPTVASGGLVNGACGYEALSQQDWPFWEVVSIGPNNPIAYKGNKKGCGYCIKATCEGAVSLFMCPSFHRYTPGPGRLLSERDAAA